VEINVCTTHSSVAQCFVQIGNNTQACTHDK
jgi:hypothetical protein